MAMWIMDTWDVECPKPVFSSTKRDDFSQPLETKNDSDAVERRAEMEDAEKSFQESEYIWQ